MLAIIEKWLSLFGNPQMFLLQEWDSQLQRTFDRWKNYENKILLQANNEQPFSLNFSPNWNFWKLNHIGEKANHARPNAEDYIASLYIDIDMKDSSIKDMDKLLQETLNTIYIDKIPVQYITQTWWWYHLWMFVKTEERYIVWEKFASKMTQLQESLADVFDWWCHEAHWMQKLMRVPLSKYWKSKPSKGTFLNKVIRWEDWLTLEPVTSPDQLILDDKLNLWIENIDMFYKNIQKVEINKKSSGNIWDIWTAQINTLSIAEVIDKLKKYPREFDWVKYEFSIKGNRIIFRMNWQLYTPDWYKINRDTNYVHNFSMTTHPIFERPRGPVFPFLYRYFNHDITLVNKFLTDEFNISLVKWEWEEGMYLCIPTESWYIYFTDKGVFYWKHMFDKKKETYKDIQVKLFDAPIYVKGIIRTKYDLFGETDEENFFYMLYNQKEQTEIMIEFTPDRKAFNKKYGKKWLIFLGEEFDLLDFYNWINKATSIIKEYDLRYLNWYYDDYYILWDTIYNKNMTEVDIEDTNILLKTQSIPKIEWLSQITLQEFWDRLCKVFSRRQSMTSLVAFISLLLWHKYWVPILESYKQQVLMPWLFLSWITRSGKTTLITILKNWAWITSEARKYSIASTTPQPLKQAASDDYLLHLEEFTWDIWDMKETLVRDILNKARNGRWQSDWWNVYYIFRSSLILDWEKLPKSESVANRCIVIPMFDTPTEKIGNEKTLGAMMGISYMQDFVQKMYEIQRPDIIKYFKQSETALRSKWIWDRNLLLYSFLLTTNKIFSIFDQDELIEAFLENIQLHKDIDKENNVLSNLLAELILRNRSIPTLKNTQNWWMISIPFTQEFKQSGKIMLMDVLKQYPNNTKYLWNTIFINVNLDETDQPLDIDTEIYNVVIPYKSYFRTIH